MSLESIIKRKTAGLLVLTGGIGGAVGCAGTSEESDHNFIELGGVSIYEAATDSEGKVFFKEEQTGEEVEVRLYPAVADTSILYFDNFLSEGFFISHPNFTPQLNIALHNSGHHYSLTPAPLQILHDSFQKERSKPAAKTFFDWAKSWKTSGWINTGCFNREEMVTLMKPGVFLMKYIEIFETVGISEEYVDQGVKYIEDHLPESAVADVYVFIPYQHGLRATTTITALDVHFDGKCAYDENSGSDDDSNNGGNNNSQDPDICHGAIFCDTFEGTSLDTNKWLVYNGSTAEVSGGWVRLTNPTSIINKNDFANACQNKRVELRTAPYAAAVYLGQLGLSTNNDSGILSCIQPAEGGGVEVLADLQVSTAGAENGYSLYKKDGLLSLSVDGEVSSIPCPKNIMNLELNPGLNDSIEIDYVKITCE